MRRNTALGWAACGVLSAAILVACGGGGEEPALATESAPDTELRGTVVAGGLDSTKVFLDLNNNQSYDPGEPSSTTTGTNGEFTLNVGLRSQAELAFAMLVAEVPDIARDTDGGLTLNSADRGGYTLMAPAAAFLKTDARGQQRASRAVISPLTTRVAAEVAFNGLTPAQATQSVQDELGLGEQDPLSDYRARPDSARRSMGRAAAIALGESTSRRALAAAQSPAAPQGETGSSRFVVKYRDSVPNSTERGRSMAGAHRGELRHSFSRIMKGFAVTIPDAQVEAFMEAAMRDPEIELVEPDQVVAALQTVQSNATWGLDRSDQRDLPLSNTYSYFGAGAGVRAYIVDTGIRASHTEFQGRVVAGFAAVKDDQGTNDCHGHGTHVAGTVGGKTWGIAKGVTLVPVRVLDCHGSGFVSGIIAGLDWIVANNAGPAVANLSLGGTASASMDAAVANAVAAGITVAVAAGNNSANACNFSPAREPSAITVGATTNSDAKSSFSNSGTCLDLFGPGSAIISAAIESDSASAVLSGTSMASPHVAGLAALYLQSNPSATPAAVAAAIKSAATTGKVTGAGAGSPNALLFTGLDSVSPPPVPPISPPSSSPIPTPVPPPPAVPSISVAALTGFSVVDRKNWRASVTIAVKNASNQLVPGVLVKGAFTVGGNKLSCTTAPNGTCVILSGSIGLKTIQTRFSVTSLAVAGTPYVPGLNTVSAITISAP